MLSYPRHSDSYLDPRPLILDLTCWIQDAMPCIPSSSPCIADFTSCIPEFTPQNPYPFGFGILDL